MKLTYTPTLQMTWRPQNWDWCRAEFDSSSAAPWWICTACLQQTRKANLWSGLSGKQAKCPIALCEVRTFCILCCLLVYCIQPVTHLWLWWWTWAHLRTNTKTGGWRWVRSLMCTGGRQASCGSICTCTSGSAVAPRPGTDVKVRPPPRSASPATASRNCHHKDDTHRALQHGDLRDATSVTWTFWTIWKHATACSKTRTGWNSLFTRQVRRITEVRAQRSCRCLDFCKSRQCRHLSLWANDAQASLHSFVVQWVSFAWNISLINKTGFWHLVTRNNEASTLHGDKFVKTCGKTNTSAYVHSPSPPMTWIDERLTRLANIEGTSASNILFVHNLPWQRRTRCRLSEAKISLNKRTRATLRHANKCLRKSSIPPIQPKNKMRTHEVFARQSQRTRGTTRKKDFSDIIHRLQLFACASPRPVFFLRRWNGSRDFHTTTSLTNGNSWRWSREAVRIDLLTGLKTSIRHSRCTASCVACWERV